MFEFQRCRSHEVQSTPMAWETQEDGLSIGQVRNRISNAFFAGGDAFRALRTSDGEDFNSDDLQWMQDNLSESEIATMKKADFVGG